MFPSLIMDTGAALTTDKCQGISQCLESDHPDNCPNSNIASENAQQVEMYSNWG